MCQKKGIQYTYNDEGHIFEVKPPVVEKLPVALSLKGKLEPKKQKQRGEKVQEPVLSEIQKQNLMQRQMFEQIKDENERKNNRKEILRNSQDSLSGPPVLEETNLMSGVTLIRGEDDTIQGTQVRDQKNHNKRMSLKMYESIRLQSNIFQTTN